MQMDQAQKAAWVVACSTATKPALFPASVIALSCLVPRTPPVSPSPTCLKPISPSLHGLLAMGGVCRTIDTWGSMPGSLPAGLQHTSTEAAFNSHKAASTNTMLVPSVGVIGLGHESEILCNPQVRLGLHTS